MQPVDYNRRPNGADRAILRAIAHYLEDTDIEQLTASYTVASTGRVEDPNIRREIARLKAWASLLRELAAYSAYRKVRR